MGCTESVPTVLWQSWEAKMPRMDGKVVAITGCTSGTGLTLANALATKGAKVVLLNRASTRADAAMKTVSATAAENGAPTPLNINCDLMSFKSVRQAGADLNAQLDKEGMDVLVNNAGIMGFPDKATEDGLDQQMQTNHTSHFLLTKLCMPLLELAAKLRGDARVVNHSSCKRKDDGIENTMQAKYLGKNGGNLGGDITKALAGPSLQRYQQTKLANIVFTYAMDKKLRAKGSKIKSLCAHPGVCAETGLFDAMFNAPGHKTAPPAPMWILVKVMGMQSQLDATVGILRQTCDPEAQSGDFFGPVGRGGDTDYHDMSEYSGKVGLLKPEPLADEKAQALLWDVSEEAIGEKFVI